MEAKLPDKASGKRKVDSHEPTNLQVRAALDAHYDQYPIGREMIAGEVAVQKAKAASLGAPPKQKEAMPPPAPKITPPMQKKEQEKSEHIKNYYTNTADFRPAKPKPKKRKAADKPAVADEPADKPAKNPKTLLDFWK